MGVLTDFFAATPGELAGMSLEWGPSPPPPEPPKAKRGLFGFGRREADPDAPLEPLGPALPTVSSKGILNTQLGTLDQFVTGTPYETLEADGTIDAIARDGGEDGPWVFPIRRELRDGLASLDEVRAKSVARQWATDEEIGAETDDDVRAIEELVVELVDLARTAISTNRDLYLWASL